MKSANTSKLKRAAAHFLMMHCSVLEAASIPTFIAEHVATAQHSKVQTPQGVQLGARKGKYFSQIICRESGVLQQDQPVCFCDGTEVLGSSLQFCLKLSLSDKQ